jgi:hypothetical protein
MFPKHEKKMNWAIRESVDVSLVVAPCESRSNTNFGNGFAEESFPLGLEAARSTAPDFNP